MKIRLTQGMVATVDARDFERVSAFRWSASYQRGRWYAVRGRNPLTYMHRFILRVPSSIEVDHRNGDGLDNRRSNLREADEREQARNRRGLRKPMHSGYKGVQWHPRKDLLSGGRWMARIRVNGKYISRVGKSEVHAAGLYNDLARQHFGQFARLNDLP